VLTDRDGRLTVRRGISVNSRPTFAHRDTAITYYIPHLQSHALVLSMFPLFNILRCNSMELYRTLLDCVKMADKIYLHLMYKIICSRTYLSNGQTIGMVVVHLPVHLSVRPSVMDVLWLSLRLYWITFYMND